MPRTKPWPENLRDLRLGKGLSQKDVGMKAGYSDQYIALVERGERIPTVVALKRIAQALGYSSLGALCKRIGL